MPNTQLRVFLSYSRADNVPGPAGESGWADALHQFLLSRQRALGEQTLQLFLDREDIRDHDDWHDRIGEKLRDADVLLVLLSPNYFASRYCREEWESFCSRQGQRGLGGEGAAIAAVSLAPVSDQVIADEARWYASVRRSNTIDLSAWRDAGSSVLYESPQAVHQAQRLLQALQARGVRIGRVQSARRGNMLEATEHFVGRREQLRQIHQALNRGAVGIVTALHGLGGIGKTELALYYAHEYAYAYPGGRWLLDADGADDLRALIAKLADDAAFPQRPTQAQRASTASLSDFVLQVLQQMAERSRAEDPDGGGQVLLVLDNVTEPALLDTAQRKRLPRSPWLSVLATSRREFAGWKRAGRVALVSVDALGEDDAVTLIREWQPRHAFRSADDAAAALQLVREYDGYTLAITQAAAYLGLHESVSVRRLLDRLYAAGLGELDAIVAADPEAVGEIAHPSARLDLILQQTLPADGTLERELLSYAALWAPTAIPQAWAEEWAQQTWPDLCDRPPTPETALERAWALLASWRLLTPAGAAGLLRMHRLIRTHLCVQCTAEQVAEGDVELGRRTVDAWVDTERGTVRDWQLDALLEQVRERLQQPDITLVGHGNTLTALLLERRGPNAIDAVAARLLACVEQIAANDPGHDSQPELSVSLNRIGEICTQQGDAEGALKMHRRSLSIDEAWVRREPDNESAQRNLTISLHRLGTVQMYQGDTNAALETFQRSLVISEALADRDPGNLQAQHLLSVSLEKVGTIREQQGDDAGALLTYRRSLAIAETSAHSDADNAQMQRGLAISLAKVANIQLRQDEVLAALQNYRRSLTIRQELAEHDRGNQQAQRDVSVGLEKIGDIQAQRGNLDAALQAYQQSLEISRALAQQNPESTQAQRDLSVSLGKLADIQLHQGDVAAAAQAYQCSLAIYEVLAQRDPTSALAQRDVAVSLGQIGDLRVRSADPAAAEPMYRRSLAIREKLAQQDPGNLSAQFDVSTALLRIGDIQLQQGDEAAALRAFERSAAMRDAVAQRRGADAVQAQRDLAISLDRVATVRAKLGDAAGASEAYRRSLTIAQALAQQHSDSAQAQRDLWVSHFKLVELAGSCGDGPLQRHHLQIVDRVLATMDARAMPLSPEDREIWRQVRAYLTHG